MSSVACHFSSSGHSFSLSTFSVVLRRTLGVAAASSSRGLRARASLVSARESCANPGGFERAGERRIHLAFHQQFTGDAQVAVSPHAAPASSSETS